MTSRFPSLEFEICDMALTLAGDEGLPVVQEEHVKQGVVKVEFIRDANNAADFLTKWVPAAKLKASIAYTSNEAAKPKKQGKTEISRSVPQQTGTPRRPCRRVASRATVTTLELAPTATTTPTAEVIIPRHLWAS